MNNPQDFLPSYSQPQQENESIEVQHNPFSPPINCKRLFNDESGLVRLVDQYENVRVEYTEKKGKLRGSYSEFSSDGQVIFQCYITSTGALQFAATMFSNDGRQQLLDIWVDSHGVVKDIGERHRLYPITSNVGQGLLRWIITKKIGPLV